MLTQSESFGFFLNQTDIVSVYIRYHQTYIVMNDNDLPLFSNTCGKLYIDRIVFASALKETSVTPQKLKKITFNRGITIGSIVIIVLSCILFTSPLYLPQAEIFFIIGLLFLILSIAKAQKTYSINLYMKDGTIRTISVWKGNRKDASKFVNKVQERFFRKPK